MTREARSDLPEWGPLILAHSRGKLREALEAMLQLDHLLARAVHTSSEPALAQLRLAWWRDQIGQHRVPPTPLPPDPLLGSIIRHWGDKRQEGLIALVDGWEQLIGDGPLGNEDRAGLCHGRGAAFADLAEIAGYAQHREVASKHGEVWGLAELVQSGQGTVNVCPSLPGLPRKLRSLAMIGGLARRSLKRGGGPMFGDRGGPFAALRLGIFGA